MSNDLTDEELLDIAARATEMQGRAETAGDEDLKLKCFALAAAANALRSDLR